MQKFLLSGKFTCKFEHEMMPLKVTMAILEFERDTSKRFPCSIKLPLS